MTFLIILVYVIPAIKNNFQNIYATLVFRITWSFPDPSYLICWRLIQIEKFLKKKISLAECSCIVPNIILYF